tara:strand:- start:268 stop:660 length:393 start_codon:yes stop_codon:yes gene_type:complete
MKKSITIKQLREFGILIGIVFPFLIGWLIPFLSGNYFHIWTLWIGLPTLIIGFIKPSLLFYPYKFWMKLGLILGWFNSRLILITIYILVLMPIAFIMRIFGYDPLRLKFEKNNSYREIRKISKIDLDRIF